MAKKVLVTVFGDYLGKIATIQANPDGTLNVILEKLQILKAEPVKYLSDRQVLKLLREMRKESDQNGSFLYLVEAKVDYDRKVITQDDILPILYPDATAIIVTRSRNWEKIPLEALGIPSPEEAEMVAKWYTLYTAMKSTLLHYHREVDRLRLDLVRYSEYARRLEERNTEVSRLLSEMQKKMAELNSEIQALESTIENYDHLLGVKEKEAEVWREAYVALKEKLKSLLDIVPTVIDYVNKLATTELEREVEASKLRYDISELEKRISNIVADIEGIKSEIRRKESAKEERKEKEEKKREEETGEVERTGGARVGPTVETGEETGEEEIIG